MYGKKEYWNINVSGYFFYDFIKPAYFDFAYGIYKKIVPEKFRIILFS